MPYFLIISHGVLHFTDIGFTKMQAASIISVMILGSGMVRFPAGWLGDRIEPRWINTISMGTMFFMFILLWKMSSFNILIVIGMVFGLCHGSQLVAFPTLISNYFGPDRFARINGVVAPFSVGFSAIVPIGGGYIFESTGDYNLAFLLLSIVSITAFIFSLFLSPPIKRI
jgi:OFA family oxalate/formate antiporter-like MFS transporter